MARVWALRVPLISGSPANADREVLLEIDAADRVVLQSELGDPVRGLEVGTNATVGEILVSSDTLVAAGTPADRHLSRAGLWGTRNRRADRQVADLVDDLLHCRARSSIDVRTRSLACPMPQP